MRDKKALLGMIMAGAMFGAEYPSAYIQNTKDKPTRKDLEQKSKKLIRNKYGLIEFEFDNVKIYARNRKNAIRKAKNQGLITE
jgi:disulfide oxidoreductase YuzD